MQDKNKTYVAANRDGQVVVYDVTADVGGYASRVEALMVLDSKMGFELGVCEGVIKSTEADAATLRDCIQQARKLRAEEVSR